MSFEGVRAKIQRAREHRALKAEITTTFAKRDNLPRVGTKYDEQTCEHVVYVSYMPDLSGIVERASLQFGDSVHNLRSALDHLVFDLALRFKKGEVKNPRRLAFPITDTESLWERERSRVADLSPDDAAVIKWYQPYEAVARANRPPNTPTLLGLLRDFDDWDKHRLLTPVAVPGAGLQDPHPQALAIWMPVAFAHLVGAYKIEPVELGTIIARTQFPDHVRLMDMDMAGYLAPRLNITEGQVELIGVLDALADRVNEIIDRLTSA